MAQKGATFQPLMQSLSVDFGLVQEAEVISCHRIERASISPSKFPIFLQVCLGPFMLGVLNRLCLVARGFAVIIEAEIGGIFCIFTHCRAIKIKSLDISKIFLSQPPKDLPAAD